MVDAVTGNTGVAGMYALQQVYSAARPQQIQQLQGTQAAEAQRLQDYKPATSGGGAEGRMQQPVKRLSDDSSMFLDEYTSAMGDVAKTAKAYAGATGPNRGADEAVSSMQDLVGAYNAAVQHLSGNTGRGAGVTDQLDRMASALPDEAAMQQLGLSANADGTLGFDASRMYETFARQDEGEISALGSATGEDGFAARLAESARAGFAEPAGRLVANDLAQAGAANPADQFSIYSKSGVQTFNNVAPAGVMMNFAV